MTIINDGTGFIYNQMRRILEIDARRALGEAEADIRVRAIGDGINTGGQKFRFYGALLTQVSGLDFSSTDTSVSTFNTSWYVSRSVLKWSEMNKKEGLLGKVDKVSGAVSNILG